MLNPVEEVIQERLRQGYGLSSDMAVLAAHDIYEDLTDIYHFEELPYLAQQTALQLRKLNDVA